MNVRARLAGLTMIIVVLCTLGYSLVGTGILWPMLGLVCVGVHLLVHGIVGRDQLMLPKWLVVTSAMAVLAWGISRALGGNKIDALCESVLALMFIKIWDRKVPSDYAQILTLAVYLAIGCTVGGDFGPVAVIVLTIPMLLAGTMLFQIYAGQHRFVRHGSRPAALRWSNGTFATFFASGFLLISLVTAMIFILMPRGPFLDSTMLRSSASWVARLGGVARVSGFSDRVELGRAGLISESRAVVAEVAVLPDEAGGIRTIDAIHLRGAVLEDYQNGLWKPREYQSARREFDSMELKPGVPLIIGGYPNSASAARAIRIRVTMRDVDRQVPIFAPWWPATVEFSGADRVRVERDSLILQRVGPEGSLSYLLTSFLGASVDPAISLARQPADRPAVDFPNAGIKKLTREVLERAKIEPDPALRLPSEDGRAARAIEAFLRREYTYTLDMLAAPVGADPIEWFLTTSKQGHCEYFASAMVAMCRGVGIPARLVTGYVAAENSNEGMFVVRESNAHAWVEAAVDGFPAHDTSETSKDPLTWHAWRTFDPTPPSDFERIHQPAPSVSLRLGKFLSSLESAWASNILRFDDRRQRGILAAQGVSTNWLETNLTKASMFFGGSEDSLKVRVMRWSGFAVLFVIGGSLLGWFATVMLARWRARVRQKQQGTARLSVRPELALLRDKYVELMASRNFVRRNQEPLLKHLSRTREQLGEIHPGLPEEIERFISGLYMGQFGRGLTQIELGEVNERFVMIQAMLTSEKP